MGSLLPFLCLLFILEGSESVQSDHSPALLKLLPIVPGTWYKLLSSAFKALKNLASDDIFSHLPPTAPGPSFHSHWSTCWSPNLCASSFLCVFAHTVPSARFFLLTLTSLPGPSHSFPGVDHTHLYLSSRASSVKLDIYIQMAVPHCLMAVSEALQCPKQNNPSLSPCHSPTWSPPVNGTTDFPVARATNLGDSLDYSPGLIHSIIKS